MVSRIFSRVCFDRHGSSHRIIELCGFVHKISHFSMHFGTKDSR